MTCRRTQLAGSRTGEQTQTGGTAEPAVWLENGAAAPAKVRGSGDLSRPWHCPRSFSTDVSVPPPQLLI